MAIASGTNFECNASATSGNVNAGGFNPANANFLADLTTDANTANTNSPVVSSASYNFAAGDVGHWLFVKSGTNWTPGYYQIASVASNKATLSAAIGQANQNINNRIWTVNTAAGCATVGTPTSGTFGIDYSRSTAARFAITDLVLATATTMTSAAFPFHPVMVGNLIHITAGTNFTPQWYEIVSVSVITATVDANAGTAGSTAGTAKVGGAISLGATGTGIGDTAFATLTTSSGTAATRVFFKGPATFTAGEAMNWGNGNTMPFIVEGYTSYRGDRPTIASGNQPTIAMGANAWSAGSTNFEIYNITGTSTQASGFAGANATTGVIGSKCFNCKFYNTSTGLAVNGGSLYFCDIMSAQGIGFGNASNATINVLYGNTFHDSAQGVHFNNNNTIAVFACNNLFIGNVTDSFKSSSTGPVVFINNTIYNGSTPAGDGIEFSNSASWKFVGLNNIFYGCAQAIRATTLTSSITPYDDYNCYYNNTSDIDSSPDYEKGQHDIAIDPAFSDVVVRNGSTATTTAGNHLVQTGATFQTWGIAAGDYLNVISGTGVTAGGYKILTVDSETQITTDGSPALSANATGDKVWRIIKNRNFMPTGAL